MTTHAYHDLPATLRGSALESHTQWPIQWTAPDTDTACRVAATLHDILHRGGLRDRYELTIDCHDDNSVITLRRTGAAAGVATPGNVEEPT